MRILHYSLGFPPARRGGMTAYCMDLMDAQAEKGDEVALLWPGPLKNKNERCAIVVGRQHALRSGKLCDSFSIDNPLPVTLVDGILDPSWQLISKSKTPFERFFDMHPFDVVHVHTLMGLPVELVVAAKIMAFQSYLRLTTIFRYAEDSFCIAAEMSVLLMMISRHVVLAIQVDYPSPRFG